MSLTVTINFIVLKMIVLVYVIDGYNKFIVLKMAVVVYVIDGYDQLYCPQNGGSGICH